MSRPGRANRMSMFPSLDAMLSAGFSLLLSVETSYCAGQIHVLRNGPQSRGRGFSLPGTETPNSGLGHAVEVSPTYTAVV
jgi:hypothetical protein